MRKLRLILFSPPAEYCLFKGSETLATLVIRLWGVRQLMSGIAVGKICQLVPENGGKKNLVIGATFAPVYYYMNLLCVQRILWDTWHVMYMHFKSFVCQLNDMM